MEQVGDMEKKTRRLIAFMKPFTQVTPARAGLYWYLDEPDDIAKILRVFKDTYGYWSIQYDNLHITPNAWGDEEDELEMGVDFARNYRGWWSGPLRMPARPKVPEEIEP